MTRQINNNDIFGRWTVMKAYSSIKNKHGYSLCKCTCGTEKEVLNYNLKHGISKSCGCLDHELASERMKNKNKTHGLSNSRLYNIWQCLVRRGLGKTAKKNYADRGITVCKEWLSFLNFFEWAKNSGYNDTLTIDRIDNNKGYYPENCRWATLQEQANNKRTNHFVLYKDRRETLANWSRILNISYDAIKYRANHNLDLATGEAL